MQSARSLFKEAIRHTNWSDAINKIDKHLLHSFYLKSNTDAEINGIISHADLLGTWSSWKGSNTEKLDETSVRTAIYVLFLASLFAKSRDFHTLDQEQNFRIQILALLS